MRTLLLPKRFALVFLLFVVACTTHAISPTNEAYPESVTTRVETSLYPTLTDKIISQPVAALIVLTPLGATHAMTRYAVNMLEPYFKGVPFIDQGLPSLFREYVGCVKSSDTGGIVNYYVNQNSENIMGRFDQYLTKFHLETDGWKEIENSNFLGKAVAISARYLPEKELPLLLTLRASINDYGASKDQKDSHLFFL